MKCIKVLKKEAEIVKNDLICKKVLVPGYRPYRDEDYIYFPVNKVIKGYKIVEKELEVIDNFSVDIGSFDQIGDIVIVAEDVSDEDAKKLIKIKGVVTVLRKKGIHYGEFRTQNMECVVGEDKRETVYKESGVNIKLNVETCYFSPRLGTERMRIAKLIKPGENVLVLFSGVAPYPLVFAKHSKAALIVGVEKNKDAHQYGIYNCRKYKNIQLFNEDAKDFKFDLKFDRVLMPLPKSAEEFLLVARSCLKKKGIIHFYDFEVDKDIPDKALDKIRSKIKKFSVLDVVKCGQYAPGRYRICVDIEISN